MDIPNLNASSYFQAISRSFESWELNPTAVYTLCGVFGAIGLSIGVFFLHRRFASAPGDKSAFTVSNPEEMETILFKALEDRSKFEISFGPQSKPHTACSLVSFSTQGIVLELPGHIVPTEDWVGRELRIFFSIPWSRKRRLHYTFSASILYLEQQGEFFRLQLPFPAQIEQQQKRRHLRLDLGLQDVSHIALWAQTEPVSEGLYFDPRSLGKPLFMKKQGRQKHTELIRLLDISGGGLRFRITREGIKQLGLDLQKSQLFLLYLELPAEQSSPPVANTLACRLRNRYQDFVSREVDIGLEFQHVVCRDPRSPDSLKWHRVDPESGVESIAHWVFKQHLKWYRNKGIQ